MRNQELLHYLLRWTYGLNDSIKHLYTLSLFQNFESERATQREIQIILMNITLQPTLTGTVLS
jgi:hypothetical protein